MQVPRFLSASLSQLAHLALEYCCSRTQTVQTVGAARPSVQAPMLPLANLRQLTHLESVFFVPEATSAAFRAAQVVRSGITPDERALQTAGILDRP